MQNIEKNTNFVKQAANNLGFDYCGIAKAEFLNEDARRLEKWIDKGMHGNMSYMQNNFELRVDPAKLVPGARSVITLLLNYYHEEEQVQNDYKISKYAFGNDYHEIIREKLNNFLSTLRNEIGEIQGRGFVDSAPVLERAWATKTGLGWIGKNGNLITKNQGSYFFIATLITDLPLIADSPFVKDYCGSCTRCIDSCPTDAILPDKVIDGSKCISYFTIELKDELLPEKMKGNFDNWMFGCDVCQEVCPWNRFSKPTNEINFAPIPEVLNFSTSDWEELSEDAFRKIFKNSPIKRTKYKGVRRNLKFLQK